MGKRVLEPAHSEVYVAMEQSMPEQVLPGRDRGLWVRSCWSRYICVPKGQQPVDKPALEHMCPDCGPVAKPMLGQEARVRVHCNAKPYGLVQRDKGRRL